MKMKTKCLKNCNIKKSLIPSWLAFTYITKALFFRTFPPIKNQIPLWPVLQRTPSLLKKQAGNYFQVLIEEVTRELCGGSTSLDFTFTVPSRYPGAAGSHSPLFRPTGSDRLGYGEPGLPTKAPLRSEGLALTKGQLPLTTPVLISPPQTTLVLSWNSNSPSSIPKWPPHPRSASVSILWVGDGSRRRLRTPGHEATAGTGSRKWPASSMGFGVPPAGQGVGGGASTPIPFPPVPAGTAEVKVRTQAWGSVLAGLGDPWSSQLRRGGRQRMESTYLGPGPAPSTLETGEPTEHRTRVCERDTG